jgi:two-component system sensor histidine kinase/response regulator
LLKNDKSEFYTEKMKTRVDHIYNAGKSTSYLLSNLLEWSRSQTGMIEFKPVKFYLRNVLEREINILSITLKEKKINILIDISDDIEVFADKNMVRTVLRNLISNAIKFTYVGGNIQIKSKTIGKHVETVVLDTGVGIASENIDKIFNLDCKLSTEGTNNEKGTGIGLILSKEFIEKNRGRIWVESEEGKGSSFIFTLPMSSDVDQ